MRKDVPHSSAHADQTTCGEPDRRDENAPRRTSSAPVKLAMCGLFVLHALRVWRAPDDDAASARAMFRFSLLYLSLLFAAMVADRLLLG